jgi:transposase-like protein
MYSLAIDQKTKILHTLVEGNSIRSTEQLAGHHRDTIMRLLVKVGKQAESVLNSTIKNIKANHIQIDEAWIFVGKKRKNLILEESFNRKLGTQFVFVAMDRYTKLILSFKLGKRELKTAVPFINDLKRKIKGRTHITSDCYPPTFCLLQLLQNTWLFENDSCDESRYYRPYLDD